MTAVTLCAHQLDGGVGDANRHLSAVSLGQAGFIAAGKSRFARGGCFVEQGAGGFQINDRVGQFELHGLEIAEATAELLPLWVVHYKWEDKTYDLLLNGQTAEIFGERPQGIVGRLFGWLAGEQ